MGSEIRTNTDERQSDEEVVDRNKQYSEPMFLLGLRNWKRALADQRIESSQLFRVEPAVGLEPTTC